MLPITEKQKDSEVPFAIPIPMVIEHPLIQRGRAEEGSGWLEGS